MNTYAAPLSSWQLRQARAKLCADLLQLMADDLLPSVDETVSASLAWALLAMRQLQCAIEREAGPEDDVCTNDTEEDEA